MNAVPPTVVAIDPAALVLHGRLLDIYYLIHHPHVTLSDSLEHVVRDATPAERELVAARVRSLKELASTVEEVLARVPARPVKAEVGAH